MVTCKNSRKKFPPKKGKIETAFFTELMNDAQVYFPKETNLMSWILKKDYVILSLFNVKTPTANSYDSIKLLFILSLTNDLNS